MPRRAAKPCAAPGCPVLVRRHSRCEKHRRRVWQDDARRRGTARERGYTHQWEKASARHKAQNPLCVTCLREGRSEPVFVTDHIVPHRGDPLLFWDETNWQSLCKTHHDAKTGAGQ